MALPLIAAGIAARAVAKKIAKNAAGTAARTRINSAAAAKVVAPKKLKGPTAKAKPYNFPGRTIKIDSNPKPVVKPAIFLSRTTGGITGAGAKQVAPINRNMGTGSVKTFSGGTKYQSDMVNKMRTEFVNDRKSGVTAKKSAAIVEKVNRDIPKKATVKIKSGK